MCLIDWVGPDGGERVGVLHEAVGGLPVQQQSPQWAVFLSESPLGTAGV